MEEGQVTGHGLIDYTVMAIFVVATVLIGYYRPNKIINIMPAAITFYFFFTFVTVLTPLKVIPPIFILTTVIANKRSYLAPTDRLWHKLVLILFCMGTLWGAYVASDIRLTVPDYQMKSRLPVQLVSYVNLVLIYLIMRRECRTEATLRQFLRAYIATTTLLCFYGVYQYFAFYTGLPFRGLIRTLGDTVSVAYDPFHDIFRINSLVTEPKRLSYMLVLSIFMIIALRRYYGDKLFSRKKARWLILLHFICTFLTYSTSIYAIVVVYFGFTMLASLPVKKLRYNWKIFIVLLLGGVAVLPFYMERLILLYELRVVSNLESERQEDYAVEYLQKYPQTLWLGVGPGIYNFVLSQEYPYGEAGVGPNGYLQPLNSAILTVLLDFGIFGCILIFWPVAAIILFRRRFRFPLAREVGLPALLFLFATCTTLNPLPMYFAFVGAIDGTRRKYSKA